MIEGGERELAFGADASGHVAFSRNLHAVRTAIRNAMFRRVEALEREDYDLLDDLAGAGRAALGGATVWDGDAWADATDPYFEEFESIGIGQAARGAEFFEVIDHVSEGGLGHRKRPAAQADELVASGKSGGSG